MAMGHLIAVLFRGSPFVNLTIDHLYEGCLSHRICFVGTTKVKPEGHSAVPLGSAQPRDRRSPSPCLGQPLVIA